MRGVNIITLNPQQNNIKIMNINLSKEEQEQLQDIVLFGINEKFRTRCRIILLRADGVSTNAIAELIGLKPRSVNRWLRAFINEGLEGLAGNLKNAMDAIGQTRLYEARESLKNNKLEKKTQCFPPSSAANTIFDASSAIRLICDNINSWDSQAKILVKMVPSDLLSLIRNDCMQTAFLLGADPLMNEKNFNIQRHEVVDSDGKIPLPGVEIASTIECGVEFHGEPLVRAKVTLKKK